MLSEGAKIPPGKTAWIELDSLTFSLHFQFRGLPIACLYLQQQHHLRGTGLGSIYQHFLTRENGSKLKAPSIRKQLKPAESKASPSSRQCWEHNGMRPEHAPHYLSATLSSIRLKRPTEVNEKVSMEINEVSVRL